MNDHIAANTGLKVTANKRKTKQTRRVAQFQRNLAKLLTNMRTKRNKTQKEFSSQSQS